jgi:hypothetical protein
MPTEKTVAPAVRSGRIWFFCLLGLIGWQAWMTLSLFGPENPCRRLLDDRPIVSGLHPLHLYHGFLGAETIWNQGNICCYDPAFQAGYPKTPVFDSSCRLGEVFLILAGGTYQPAAYKVGLAVCLLSIPLFLIVAARSVGLSGGGTFFATAAGLMVCWGIPGRTALEEGDLDLFIAALAGLTQYGLLIQYHRHPTVPCWLGILLTGCLGWLANPILLAVMFPLVLLYYLTVGARHRHLTWHLAFFAGLAGGIGMNVFWLIDWVQHWWIRSPLQLTDALLPHRTIHTIWTAALWGDPLDRTLSLGLIGSAMVGVLLFNKSHQRATARLLGIGVAGLLGLAILGIASEQLGRLGTAHLLVPALWFATLPAAHALVQSYRLVKRVIPNLWYRLGIALTLIISAELIAPDLLAAIARRSKGTTSLTFGLTPEREKVVACLIRATRPKARILWEDFPDGKPGSRWTSLLPMFTGRYFLGGLDPDSAIEHSYASFVDQNLAGRPVIHWSDAQLEEFCRRYNVGWIVCWSPAAHARISTWKKARPILQIGEHDQGCIYALQRPFSYALRGSAQLVHADSRHITLADVVPHNGKVVLSFHYQTGLRASPSRVQVEPEPDASDPIPFIRLNVTEPVARLTLTWEDR